MPVYFLSVGCAGATAGLVFERGFAMSLGHKIESRYINWLLWIFGIMSGIAGRKLCGVLWFNENRGPHPFGIEWALPQRTMELRDAVDFIDRTEREVVVKTISQFIEYLHKKQDNNAEVEALN